MKVEDFDYFLPEELIAQEPVNIRDQSRLMILNRRTGLIEERHFKDVVDYLEPGDLLVLNDSRVIPARLFGKKLPTGTVIEVFLLNQQQEGVWEVLVRPGRRVRKGVEISFGDGRLIGKTLDYTEYGGRIMGFSYQGSFQEIISELGKVPLPPYIKQELKEPERYQTVYARHNGSVAAPTAGLHFTPDLLNQIKDKGVKISYITLHVGLGTFRPVKTEEIEDHDMHIEYYELGADTADRIKEAQENNKRIIAVGTTVTRTLETIASKDHEIKPQKGWTDIFIYPGYEFKVINGLITNFHLPRSTLLMLISAFAGRERVLRAYQKAVENRYRFFSLGDAMFIY